jgi:hypothetical protein
MDRQDVLREMLRRFNPRNFVTWVYRKGQDKMGNPVWDVGYYTPSGEWRSDRVYYEKGSASARVRMLNGG